MISRRQLWSLVALTLMWGVNWPMMKYSLRELSPLYFRAFTMSFGALFLFSYYRVKGVRMLPRGAEWRSVVTLGLPNMLAWHTFAILGVKELASGRAAILGFTMPIWTVLLGALLLGERLTRRVAFAAAAVALAIMLLTANEFTAIAGRPMGIVWMELAALSWAAGTLMLRRARLSLPIETLTVWMMILTSACLWLIAALNEPWPAWSFSALMWGSLAYGALINYGFAQTLWAGLARHLPPATSAMSIMAVPLVGTLSATLIVGEWPHWQDFVAALCVMAAIAAVLLPSRPLKPLTPSA
ncbi:MAG: DMT family transporter [Gammaproteobacteria bacterium]|uniref:DMT family transporter n=1 Tax=Rhodoferax sp. TaxID=50421 RepID=UPI0017D42982|nr:DMT family transporter [Rhodoferax sp.]MBU3900034.1 DMT family transporter [Gammaproteobacteria bacterium]MBA3059709.1 DMT family transporter [Rhodoferax sp.]MBU3999398.1 DMT family transporter [Gammaproteobacteria bacterium]MBU4082072.1 DMT family transporter [Gammaproteobacteria bacterium]MBU4113867.1 DMT family transporter [Gammaproteobacteria bacterium]